MATASFPLLSLVRRLCSTERQLAVNLFIKRNFHFLSPTLSLMDAVYRPSSSLRLDESFRSLPSLYLTLLCFWFISTLFWAFINYRNRHSQMSNLQWTLAAVPVIKALQLTLSFFFWYSCFYLERCSLWMSFGMYVMGVLFQTASFVSFFIISNGYCITCEHLSLPERRTTAFLGCIFYLTLVGYRASVPYFAVLLLLNYFFSFYTIFYRISRNLSVLWQQLNFIEDEGADAMHDVVYTKYLMFKKFQIVMHMVAMSEIIVYGTMDDSVEKYWLRLSVRELGLLCFFLYIGWIFRSQNLPHFSVMPTMKSNSDIIIPPIYSIEMDAATFRNVKRHKWHIGVPTLHSDDASSRDPILVIL